MPTTLALEVRPHSCTHGLLSSAAVGAGPREVIAANCDSTRMSVIDINGMLTLYDIEARPPSSAVAAGRPTRHFVRVCVCVCVSRRLPWAVVERQLRRESLSRYIGGRSGGGRNEARPNLFPIWTLRARTRMSLPRAPPRGAPVLPAADGGALRPRLLRLLACALHARARLRASRERWFEVVRSHTGAHGAGRAARGGWDGRGAYKRPSAAKARPKTLRSTRRECGAIGPLDGVSSK